MSHQSEAKLEQKLIERLEKLNFQSVKIEDYDALLRNFRVQINKFNSEVLKGSELTDLEFKRLLNHMKVNITIFGSFFYQGINIPSPFLF